MSYNQDIILKVENISKQYRLGVVGTGTISHDLNRWWHKVRGKEDPYVKIGATNDRSTTSDSEYVWALKDINFTVNRGEVLGIIGKNGAGKSTLLKILSRVTGPTTGSIKTRGRIASLLEVGTGFHPELTGRENIYLNGAILGMTRKEISEKIDEIIDFSGCQRYVDTPVKRYSSGMTVRLAFAVAAHLEPDILIVDEVLAVGDAEFQKKAIGKMQDISSGQGRTVLFVSHNMGSINQLCSRTLVLKNGELVFDGSTAESIKYYLDKVKFEIKNKNIDKFIEHQNNKDLRLLEMNLVKKHNKAIVYYSDQSLSIRFKYEFLKANSGIRIGYDLINAKTDVLIFRSFHDDSSEEISQVSQSVLNFVCTIPSNLLNEGYYKIKPIAGIHNNRWIINEDDVFIQFEIKNIGGVNRAYMEKRPGVIMPSIKWVLLQ